MECQLEHASITVRSITEAVRFITTAFPHFKIRGGSKSSEGNKWLHLGTDSSYIALIETNNPPPPEASRGIGITHLGFVVNDLDGIRDRMAQARYQGGVLAAGHPYRRRVYFSDADGLEWEFIEYLSDDLAERNDYSL